MKNFEKYKTAKERARAFRTYCESQKDCYKCSLRNPSCTVPCCLKWLDLESEEEKPLPCPFCGSNTNLFHALDGRHAVHCLDIYRCKYASGEYASDEEAIAAHNRVARAVMANKEGDKDRS